MIWQCGIVRVILVSALRASWLLVCHAIILHLRSLGWIILSRRRLMGRVWIVRHYCSCANSLRRHKLGLTKTR